MAQKPKDNIEVTYLTNACGEDTGYGTVRLKKSDYAKVPFEQGPGCVLLYIVQIAGKPFALGNLEVAYKDAFWGTDAQNLDTEDNIRAYCEAASQFIRPRLTDGMMLLPLDEGDPGRITIPVAVPLKQLADSDATLEAMKQAFGPFVDLPDLAEVAA